jgi:predicted TIM-barrel enzyme
VTTINCRLADTVPAGIWATDHCGQMGKFFYEVKEVGFSDVQKFSTAIHTKMLHYLVFSKNVSIRDIEEV